MLTIRILKGGSGSGNFGHAGREGKVGGSSTTGGISPNISDTLASFAYDKFTSAKDENKFIVDNIERLSSDLGFNTNVSVVQDRQFNESVSKDANIAGVSANMIKAYCRAKSGTMVFRTSTIDNIKSQNDYRLLLNMVFHEVGHAYSYNIMKISPTAVRSQGEYDNSRDEEFADLFSSRLGLSMNKTLGSASVPKSLRESSIPDYLKASEGMY